MTHPEFFADAWGRFNATLMRVNTRMIQNKLRHSLIKFHEADISWPLESQELSPNNIGEIFANKP